MTKQNYYFQNSLIVSALLNTGLVFAACRTSLLPPSEPAPHVQDEVRIHLYIPQRPRIIAVSLPLAAPPVSSAGEPAASQPGPAIPALQTAVALPQPNATQAAMPQDRPNPVQAAVPQAPQPAFSVMQSPSVQSVATGQTASYVASAAPGSQPVASAPQPQAPTAAAVQPAPVETHSAVVADPPRTVVAPAPSPAVQPVVAPEPRHPRTDLADGAVPEVIGDWPDLNLSSDIDPATFSSTVVVVTFEVDESGRPTHVRIKESSGNSDVDDSARNAIDGMRFRPAQQGGEAISARMSHEWRLQ